MPCVRNLSVQRHGPPAGRLRQAPPRRAGLSCARAVPLFQPLLLRWAVSLPRDLRNPGPFRLRRQAAYARALRRGGPLFLRWQIPLCLQALNLSKGAAKEQQKFFRSPRLPKNQREGQSPFALQSSPAACTAGTGRFLRRKISFSRAKIASLQFPRPEIRRILAETGEGGSGGGARSARPVGEAARSKPNEQGSTASRQAQQDDHCELWGACSPVHQLVNVPVQRASPGARRKGP